MASTNKKGKNLEDIQHMNRALVIGLLRKREVCSRVELAKTTGLKQATITNIVNELLDCGLVKETGIQDGERGRRSIGLTFNGERYMVIGVRVARKYFVVGLFDIAGKEYEIVKENIDISSGAKNALKKIVQSISGIMGRAESKSILGIGVAIPGPFFRWKGKIGLITQFPGWEEISIKDELETTFELPTFVDHDANVGALAEWWLGRSHFDSGTMVYVAAGQGIGAGIICDGKPFTGAMGIAGEIGHMSISYNGPKCECGNSGCLEQYCSTIALLKEAEKQLDKYPGSILTRGGTLEQFFKALEAGDELAVQVFEKAAEFLGLGIVNILYAYNPHVVVIGDELAQAGQKLLEIIQNTVRRHVLPDIYNNVTIQLSSFNEDPALVGAGSMVIDNVKNIVSYINNNRIHSV